MIQVNDLCKVYKNGKIEVLALKDASFHIDAGEFTAIMGASGSGKSTLMNILGCLDQATSGTYILDSQDVSKMKGSELARVRNKKIGFVFQSFNLLPKLSAFKNVELPMIYAGMSEKKRREKTTHALERVGLTDRMKHKPNELSGGQRQRVAIARSLVNNPAILLADEPTGNLDSRSSEEIMEIFKNLNQEGVTILMVTHESDIANHTKRILSFKDGMLQSDTPVRHPAASAAHPVPEAVSDGGAQ